MKRLLVTGITLVMIFLTAGNAAAQRNLRANRVDMISSLNLTDAQVSKIDALRTKHQKIMVDLRADLQKSVIDQKELFSSGDVQKDKYLAAVDKTNKIREKMSLERANHQMDIYSVLDKDQKAKFDKFRGTCGFGNNRGMMRGGRFGNGGRGSGRGNCNGNGPGAGMGMGFGPGF